MPIVRSPCTLLWPRTGQSPAPGRPMLPRSSTKLTISRIVATALRCWVMPIAQHTTMRSAVTTSSTAASISSPRSPLASRARSTSRARRWSAKASKPSVWASMKAPSIASRSSSRRLTSWKRARSPLTRTCRKRSASSRPRPRMPRRRWGFLKRIRPASGSGLTAMIRAPRSFARSRAVSIRGWLVPGFCPTTIRRSAASMSSSDTEPLPTPMVSVRATPLDSWHMFEQSGRLLVPKRRASSW